MENTKNMAVDNSKTCYVSDMEDELLMQALQEFEHVQVLEKFSKLKIAF